MLGAALQRQSLIDGSNHSESGGGFPAIDHLIPKARAEMMAATTLRAAAVYMVLTT